MRPGRATAQERSYLFCRITINGDPERKRVTSKILAAVMLLVSFSGRRAANTVETAQNAEKFDGLTTCPTDQGILDPPSKLDRNHIRMLQNNG